MSARLLQVAGLGRVPDQPDALVAALGEEAFQQECDLPMSARDHNAHGASLLMGQCRK